MCSLFFLPQTHTLIEMLYQLSMFENEVVQQEPEVTSEKEKKSRHTVWDSRASKSRTAGCKMFFWKTWAIC